MFEELSGDVKEAQDYLKGKIFDKAADISFDDSEALEEVSAKSEISLFNEISPDNMTERFLESFPEAEADCVTSRNSLHLASSPETYIAAAAKCLKSGGIFILSDIVVDLEDAYLNVAEFEKDPRHRRYYTLGEIISLTEKYFRVEYFKRLPKTLRLETWAETQDKSKIQAVSREFLAMPEAVKESLNFVISDGELLGFSLQAGLFVLKKI